MIAFAIGVCAGALAILLTLGRLFARLAQDYRDLSVELDRLADTSDERARKLLDLEALAAEMRE